MWGVWRHWRPHRSPATGDDVGEEIQDHLRRRAADLVARGLDPPAAARQAAIDFGSIEGYKEQARHVVRGGGVGVFVEQAWLEFTRAVRRLARTPVFTIFSIVSLGVGIGVTVAAYAVLDDWATPWTARDADHIVALGGWGNGLRSTIPDTDFEIFAARQHTLRQVVVSAPLRESFRERGQSYPVVGEAVSGGYFDLLGITPLTGRILGAADQRSEADGAVVLNERFWRERLAADPGTVGSVIYLGELPFTVVGIVADRFPGLTTNLFDRADCWLPYHALRRFHLDGSTSLWFGPRVRVMVLGQLAPGRTVADVSRDAHDIGVQLDLVSPRFSELDDHVRVAEPRNWRARPLSELNTREGFIKGSFIALFFVSMIVIVACTNLANLMLARGARRRTERTVRRALGASRFRLMTEVVIEGAVLAAAGGAASAVVAQVLMVSSARRFQYGWRTFLLAPQWSPAALAIVFTAIPIGFIVFGLVPAWRLSRTRTLAMATTIAEPPQLRSSLIVLQVAVACALMLIGAMCVRAAQNADDHDTGVDYQRVSLAQLDFYASGSAVTRARAAEEAILRDAQTRPEFESVAVASAVPFGLIAQSSFRVATLEESTRALGGDATVRTANAIAATPGIFRTLDIAIVDGRPLDNRDQPGPNPNIVINDVLARQAFGTTDAVGRRLSLQGDSGIIDRATILTARIVGVTESTDTAQIYGRNSALIYLPRNQIPTLYSVILARCRVAPSKGVGVLIQAIHAADPSIVVDTAGTGSELLVGDYAYLIPFAEMFITLGMIAMVIACIGLYGVLAEVVSRRRQELGVRLALGAEPARLVHMVIAQGIRPVLRWPACSASLSRCSAESSCSEAASASANSSILWDCSTHRCRCS